VALLENAKLTLIQNILSPYASKSCLPIAEILVLSNAVDEGVGMFSNYFILK